jgi:hypothetical protein
MGQDKKTTQTTGSMPRESSQVGTHGDTGSKDWSQGQGQPMKEAGQGNWNDRAQRPMQDGDQTRPTQPSGTKPLDKNPPAGTQNRPNR